MGRVSVFFANVLHGSTPTLLHRKKRFLMKKIQIWCADLCASDACCVFNSIQSRYHLLNDDIVLIFMVYYPRIYFQKPKLWKPSNVSNNLLNILFVHFIARFQCDPRMQKYRSSAAMWPERIVGFFVWIIRRLECTQFSQLPLTWVNLCIFSRFREIGID